MELQIYNPTDENAIKKIDWNYEELKQPDRSYEKPPKRYLQSII